MAIFVIVFVIGKKKVRAIICLLLQPTMNSTLSIVQYLVHDMSTTNPEPTNFVEICLCNVNIDKQTHFHGKNPDS